MEYKDTNRCALIRHIIDFMGIFVSRRLFSYCKKYLMYAIKRPM